MPTNMNSYKRTPLLELLLKGLDDVNETIIRYNCLKGKNRQVTRKSNRRRI